MMYKSDNGTTHPPLDVNSVPSLVHEYSQMSEKCERLIYFDWYSMLLLSLVPIKSQSIVSNGHQ